MTEYLLLESGGDNRAYGIEARCDGTVVRYEAVTDDKNAMERLASLCNEEKLSLCHLEDVLEDYLTDFCV